MDIKKDLEEYLATHYTYTPESNVIAAIVLDNDILNDIGVDELKTISQMASISKGKNSGEESIIDSRISTLSPNGQKVAMLIRYFDTADVTFEWDFTDFIIYNIHEKNIMFPDKKAEKEYLDKVSGTYEDTLNRLGLKGYVSVFTEPAG